MRQRTVAQCRAPLEILRRKEVERAQLAAACLLLHAHVCLAHRVGPQSVLQQELEVHLQVQIRVQRHNLRVNARLVVCLRVYERNIAIGRRVGLHYLHDFVGASGGRSPAPAGCLWLRSANRVLLGGVPQVCGVAQRAFGHVGRRGRHLACLGARAELQNERLGRVGLAHTRNQNRQHCEPV